MVQLIGSEAKNAGDYSAYARPADGGNPSNDVNRNRSADGRKR